MEITLPSDCGNAPRIGIVSDFVVHWASGDSEAVAAWLADDVRWTLIGDSEHDGPEAAREVCPPFLPDRVELVSVITHGRLASCDGYLAAGDRRIDFSHAIRFSSTAKTAKIAELRSYLIEADAD